MYLRFVLLSLIFSLFCVVIIPQQSSLGGIFQQYNLSSGQYDGSNLKKPTIVYSKIISLPNTNWIQVHFNSVNLGKNSYLTIESIEDNSRQALNSVDIEQWDLSSAFFNGDSLLISLYAGPGDKNIFFNITEIFIGESAAQSFNNAPNQPNGVEDFCSTDNRVFSNEKAVCRIIKGDYYSTGFLIYNGTILTAGHVLAGVTSTAQVHFNVPTSNSNGSVRFPSADDQYIMYKNYIIGTPHNNGEGDDWGVFYTTITNGKSPIQRQNAFFYVEQNNSFQDVRVTGFGRDNGDHNHAQQTSSGQNQGSSGNILKYSVYTQDDCSGSPVINQTTGKVVGIHTTNHCSDGYNSGTSFFNQSLWSAINPEIDLTIHQKLEDGSELTGSNVGRWVGPLSTGNFMNYPVSLFGALIENVVYGNYETFRAKQDLTSDPSKEKFNNWTSYPDVVNHRKFLIEYEGTTELVAQFKKTFSGVSLKNEYPEVPGLNPANDVIEFKDPWLIDYEDPEYNGTTYRNRGQETSQFKSRTTPFTPDSNSYYGTDRYLGVFLDQTATPGNSFYSVRSPIQQPQVIYLSQTGKNHKFYFSNWSSTGTDNLTQNNIIDGYYETPVVFRNSSASVTAVLKGAELTNNINAFGNNSQKKLVRTTNGYLHKVYESINKVWYERSTDNGTTWQIMNGGKPLDGGAGKLPAIDYRGDAIGIVWQENFYGALEIKVAYFYNGIMDNDYPTVVFSDGNQPYTNNANPVIGWEYNSRILVAWENKSSNVLPVGIVCKYGSFTDMGFSPGDTEVIQGTDINSSTPSIAANKSSNLQGILHLVWLAKPSGSYGSNTINYCKITGDGLNQLGISGTENVSSGSGYQVNDKPSITLNSTNYPTVAWVGTPYPGSSSSRIVNRTRVDSNWSPTFNLYDDWVDSPTINYSLSDANTVIAWSRNNGAQNKFLRNGAIKTFGTMGRNIQLANSQSLSSMYAVSFRNESLPYYFSTTPNVGSIAKETDISVNSGREIIVTKNDVSMFYILGDIKLDGQIIGFNNVNEFNIKKIEDAELYLLSEPMQINNLSKLTFNTEAGVSDSLGAINLFKGKNSLKFKIVLIDEKGAVIGECGEVLFNNGMLTNLGINSYSLNLNEVKNGKVRLFIKVDDNLEGDYTIGNILDDEYILPKVNVQNIKLNDQLTIKSYDLEQNYPNPFNPSTTITYQLPKDGMVTLKIYDAIGTEVTTLVNEYKPTGRYNVTFNASNLASGVYFYRLQVNDFTSSKKLILMK